MVIEDDRALNDGIYGQRILCRLRMKVEENPEQPAHIKTVFGLGYKWEDGGL